MRKYNLEIIGYINTLENISKVHVKDCFTNRIGQLIFIIEQGEGGKAIGKNGSNIKRLGAILNKSIKIIEYNIDPVRFLNNIIYPIKSENIYIQDNEIRIDIKSTQDKTLLIGREQANLKEIQEIITKYFPYKVVVK
ncbi:MAG: NusA-like transcription termination signal-binding factor [Candidatus Woesearchaeota archaeon]|nr:NusA-like transcription termination signal-binding factor [Candidatus Woesearchaeota archaeon]